VHQSTKVIYIREIAKHGKGFKRIGYICYHCKSLVFDGKAPLSFAIKSALDIPD